MDAACIGATGIAKMSERRNNRLIDGSLSDLPWFLIKNPGLSSGLMIPQYAQAGLLNDMRMLCTPATIDNTPTCGNQEDYVSMGYNSAKKSIAVAEKLEYILAIELLSVFEGQQFREPELKRSSVSRDVLDEIVNDQHLDGTLDVRLLDAILLEKQRHNRNMPGVLRIVLVTDTADQHRAAIHLRHLIDLRRELQLLIEPRIT